MFSVSSANSALSAVNGYKSERGKEEGMTTGARSWDDMSKEEALRRIERMLTRKSTVVPGQPPALEQSVPSYNDLTALNTSRLVLDSVGSSLLTDIISDFLDLLETSCVVHEKNGDYALGIFSSSWCRFLNQSSRERCGTPDHREALASGQWHCHESCWNEASRRSIETGKPADVACRGGIRLFAVPIRAGKEIVGTIGVGYGDPPRDPAKLRELAAAYGVSVEELGERAVAYETRPVFIFELAKKRLLSAARLIGEIVDRKQTEEALRTSEAKYREMYEGLLDGSAAVNMEGTIIEFNPAFQQMLGYTREEIHRLTYEDITPKEWHSLEANIIATQVLERGYSDLYEKEYRRKDGTIFPVELRTYLIREKSGKPVGMWAFVRDISERKRAEEALRESEERLKFVLEGSELGFWDWNIQTGEVQRNERWAEMLGYTLPEIDINFRHWTDLLHPDDRAAASQSIQDHLEGRIPVHECEYRMRTKDGQYKWILDRARIVQRDAQGRPVRMSGTHTDISEQKWAEERITRLNSLKERLLGRGTLHEKLRLITDGVVEIFGADFARIWITKEGDLCEKGCRCATVTEGPHVCRNRSSCLHLVASSGRYTHIDGGHRRVPLGCYKIGRIGSGEDASFLTNDVTHDPRVHDHEWAETLGLTSFAGFRLLSQDNRPLGVLALFSKRPIAPDEVRLLEALANTTSQIIRAGMAEETLRESESLLRAVLDNTPFELWVRDRDGRCIMQNAALEKRWGSLLGQRPEDAHVSRATLETWQATNRRALAGEVVDGEWEYTLAGEKRSYHTILAPVRVGEEIRGILGFNMDITERKRTREALRESNEALQALIQASPVAINVLDPEGNVKLWNPAAERMFGWREEEVLGRFLPYVSEENREEHRALRERVLQGEPFTGVEVRRRRKDGSPIDISVSTAPLRDAKGNITAIMSVNLDITERKRAEEEREKLEAQMREVQKLESLGVLAGGIAHDFNNLLMAILGNADLALLSLSPASPVRQNLEEIVRASQRAADLCRQMLAYSGKGRFVVDRYDLSEIVREMAQMLEVSVSKKASLRYLFAEELPPVEADATQMRQIIMNLITNASEALGDESGVISVATGVMECDRAYLSESYLDDKLPEGWYVYLEVSDTGCGMDAETRSRIFDPFFTTKFTGRGLGLAAVLGIVRGHKGAIKVYSEPGKGTAFKILLPALEWKPGDRPRIAEQSAAPRGGGTILLVDDDAYVRDVGSKMLERLGFQVLTAANGREGLDVFRRRGAQIDCVILDLTMPEMGGEEAFRELRRLRSDVCVILSSGYNEQDVVQRFVGKGLAGFVQKPYTVAKLGEILNLVFG